MNKINTSTAIDVTYAELLSLINGDALCPGATYRITDFRLRHYIVDGNYNVYTTGDGIVTGPLEPLVVQATDVNQLSPLAFSVLYPRDVIHYDWDAANWLGDISLATNGTIIPGWRGTITYRHDTIRDNYAHYDWRHALTRRWAVDAPAWAAGTYNQGDLVTHSAKIYRALATTSQEPPQDNWALLFDLTELLHWNNNPVAQNGIPSNAGDYADYPLYRDYEGVRNNHIALHSTHSRYGALSTVGAAFQYNTVGEGFARNTVGAWFEGNTVGASFEDNAVGEGFINNVIGDYFNDNSESDCQRGSSCISAARGREARRLSGRPLSRAWFSRLGDSVPAERAACLRRAT